MRYNFITLHYIVASFLCEIKIPATSLLEFELYVTVTHIKRANIMFITKYVAKLERKYWNLWALVSYNEHTFFSYAN